jgi:hypothetical protein
LTGILLAALHARLHRNFGEVEQNGRVCGRWGLLVGYVKSIVGSMAALAAYHVIPVRWSSPVIEQVFLPAHAATSGSSLHDPCSVELRGGDSSSQNVIIKVAGYVTPPTANLSVLVTATANGGANQKAEGKTTTNNAGNFEVFLTVGGGPGITSINVQTVVTGASGVANCVVHLGSQCTNPTCTGDGTVYASSTATLVVSDTNTMDDDILEVFVNGVSLGTTNQAWNSPSTFNNVNINLGSNTISFTYVSGSFGTSKQMVLTSGGVTFTRNPGAGSSYTVCGVCAGTQIGT